MAELADALASGASGGNTLEVQVLLTAPYLAVVAELADALLCGGSVHKTYGFKSHRPHHLKVQAQILSGLFLYLGCLYLEEMQCVIFLQLCC